VSLTIVSATISANTDNWNPTGLATASALRVTLTANWNLTGIVAPSDDRLMILDNIGGGTLTLKHDVTSTAANRFLCVGDVDMTLPVDGWTWLQYDFTSSRWRVLGTSATIPAGTYELAIEGGQDVIKAHGAMGATETFDPTDGNVHTGTLDADCTFTLNVPTGSGAATLEFWITQDGTGGWTITWPGSVTWDGGAPTPDTSAGVTVRYILETIDGGTNWIGDLVGAGITSSSFATPAIVLGTAAAAGTGSSVIRHNSTIVAFDATVPTTQAFGDAAATGSAAVAARRDHLHGMPADPGSVGPQHVHVDNVTFSGDGATTVFTLPAAPVDAYSIGVYVGTGRNNDWVLSGTLLDTLTFGSAPTSGTDNISIDIAAAL
jgi:hypothetical protein